MNRHYYISDNLDDLETIEYELEASGINSEQIHVLSKKVADVEEHHLHEVNSLMEQDCLLYTSPSPRDGLLSRMPSSA